MGLRASFGHLFMVWAADDCLVNPFNLVSRDLRRLHTRVPFTWAEKKFSDAVDNGIMSRSVRGIQQTQVRFTAELCRVITS